MCILMTSH